MALYSSWPGAPANYPPLEESRNRKKTTVHTDHSQFSCPLWSFPKRKTTRHGLKGLHARCGSATVHINLLCCSSCCCGAHHASRSAPTPHTAPSRSPCRVKKHEVSGQSWSIRSCYSHSSESGQRGILCSGWGCEMVRGEVRDRSREVFKHVDNLPSMESMSERDT